MAAVLEELTALALVRLGAAATGYAIHEIWKHKKKKKRRVNPWLLNPTALPRELMITELKYDPQNGGMVIKQEPPNHFEPEQGDETDKYGIPRELEVENSNEAEKEGVPWQFQLENSGILEKEEAARELETEYGTKIENEAPWKFETEDGARMDRYKSIRKSKVDTGAKTDKKDAPRKVVVVPPYIIRKNSNPWRQRSWRQRSAPSVSPQNEGLSSPIPPRPSYRPPRPPSSSFRPAVPPRPLLRQPVPLEPCSAGTQELQARKSKVNG